MVPVVEGTVVGTRLETVNIAVTVDTGRCRKEEQKSVADG